MASLTIRKLDETVKTYLRLRSARNGRSVEEEVRVILGELIQGRPYVAGDAFKASRLGVNREMALLARLWSGMGSPANLTKVGADVGVTHDVVSRHVGYLRDSFLRADIGITGGGRHHWR